MKFSLTELEAAKARVVELEEALRELIGWADGEQGDAFGDTEWRIARAAADDPFSQIQPPKNRPDSKT